MNTPDLDSIIAKVQKLINLQEGAQAVGSYAEAENAATRVQEYLLKYNLSMDEVMNSNIQEKIKMVAEEFDLDEYQAKTEANWVHSLITVIAKSFLCEAILLSGTRKGRHNYDQGFVKVLGDKNNVAIVMYTVEQLISKIHIAEKFAYKDYYGNEKRNTFKRGFLIGAVKGIASKLRTQEAEIINTNNQMGLMVISKKKELMEFFNDQFPKTKSIKKGPLSSKDGKAQGYEAGRNMNINKGMNNSQTKGHLQ